MYLDFPFVILQISVSESRMERDCKGTSKWEMQYREIRDLMSKCGKMLTGYFFCLAPAKECQRWLRHNLYVFGGRKGGESQGERRKGNLILS